MNTQFDETIKELAKNCDNFELTLNVKELNTNETQYIVKGSKVRQETIIERIIKWCIDQKRFKQLRDAKLKNK